MKDFRLMAAMLMAGGMMVACSSDNDFAQQPAPVDNTPKVYTVTVEGAQKGGDATKGWLFQSAYWDYELKVQSLKVRPVLGL